MEVRKVKTYNFDKHYRKRLTKAQHELVAVPNPGDGLVLSSQATLRVIQDGRFARLGDSSEFHEGFDKSLGPFIYPADGSKPRELEVGDYALAIKSIHGEGRIVSHGFWHMAAISPVCLDMFGETRDKLSETINAGLASVGFKLVAKLLPCIVGCSGQMATADRDVQVYRERVLISFPPIEGHRYNLFQNQYQSEKEDEYTIYGDYGGRGWLAHVSEIDAIPGKHQTTEIMIDYNGDFLISQWCQRVGGGVGYRQMNHTDYRQSLVEWCAVSLASKFSSKSLKRGSKLGIDYRRQAFPGELLSAVDVVIGATQVNGDCVCKLIRKAQDDGDFIAYRDNVGRSWIYSPKTKKCFLIHGDTIEASPWPVNCRAGYHKSKRVRFSSDPVLKTVSVLAEVLFR
jgi:hypothetical protein